MPKKKVRDVMSKDVETIAPDSSLLEAADKMKRSRSGSIIVVDGGRPVGVLTERDLLYGVISEGRIIPEISEGEAPEEVPRAPEPEEAPASVPTVTSEEKLVVDTIENLMKIEGKKYEDLETLEKDVVIAIESRGHVVTGDDRVLISRLVQEHGYTGKFKIDDMLAKAVGGRKQLAIISTVLLFILAALGENYVVPFIVDTFTNEAPAAVINSPAEMTKFAQGARITLSGSSNDPEDGLLGEDSLLWHSSIDGDIGTGSQIDLTTLSVGEHLITLTARDSKGSEAKATTNIIVIAHEILDEIKTSKKVLVKDEEVEAYVKVWKPIVDEKAPEKGWVELENPFYKIRLNLDHSYYMLFDKIQGKEVLVYNDQVEDKISMLTGSTLGYADLDGANMVSFSSMALHDVDGIGRYRVLLKDEENGFLLFVAEGYDFQPTDPTSGYDVEGEVMFGLFADKPYFIDATELNNLQTQGVASKKNIKNPDEIVKDWVITGDYDSGVIRGGDPQHLNFEMWEPFYTVQTLEERKAWHAGSAQFSKMFPDHVLIGNKISGGIMFSLPQGRFRFDDSLGIFGDQIACEFFLLVKEPEKAISFSVEPVNRNCFFYDFETYQYKTPEQVKAANPGASEEDLIGISMDEICQKHGLECPDSPLDVHNWSTKRFAFVVTLVDNWYDQSTNEPREGIWELASLGVEDFSVYEETIYRELENTRPLSGTKSVVEKATL